MHKVKTHWNGASEPWMEVWLRCLMWRNCWPVPGMCRWAHSVEGAFPCLGRECEGDFGWRWGHQGTEISAGQLLRLCSFRKRCKGSWASLKLPVPGNPLDCCQVAPCAFRCWMCTLDTVSLCLVGGKPTLVCQTVILELLLHFSK